MPHLDVYKRQPMTVSDLEMDRFMQAVSSSDSPKYYLPEEITPQMLSLIHIYSLRPSGGQDPCHHTVPVREKTGFISEDRQQDVYKRQE